VDVELDLEWLHDGVVWHVGQSTFARDFVQALFALRWRQFLSRPLRFGLGERQLIITRRSRETVLDLSLVTSVHLEGEDLVMLASDESSVRTWVGPLPWQGKAWLVSETRRMARLQPEEEPSVPAELGRIRTTVSE
jgi:hypothetical protein